MKKAAPKPYKHYGTTGLFAQPLSESLQKFQSKHFQKSTLEAVRLANHWQSIVGDDLSQLSRPEKIRYQRHSAVLDLAAAPAIALEIQHMQPVLIQRIGDVLGHRKIARIKIVPLT